MEKPHQKWLQQSSVVVFYCGTYVFVDVFDVFCLCWYPEF